ncbi:MAG: iron ABC transporter permease [Pirellulales bacterium]|nr:iron ABC transporter permease [Pirellulales bacterium]
MDQRTFPSLTPTTSDGRRSRCSAAGLAPAALLIAAVFLLPLAGLWLPGGADFPIAESSPPIAWKALVASLAVAVAAAVAATAVGSLLAVALTLTEIPGRSLWAAVLLLPFLCPRAVWALGQLYCYGAGGLMERWCGGGWRALAGLSDNGHYLATLLVLAEIHAPLAMLLVSRGLARLQHAGFDSARLLLSPSALVRWTAAAVRPEMAAAFLLTFALSLGEFAVPDVLQCPLYSVEIFLRVVNYFDHAGAARAALPLLVLALLATGGMTVVERRRGYVSDVPSPARTPWRLGKKIWLVGGLLGLYLLATSLLPLAAMIYEVQSPACFWAAIGDAAEETRNTLEIALAAGLLACLAGIVMGLWSADRGGLAAGLLAMTPLGIPTLILGLAYLRFFNRSWPIDLAALGNTSAVVVLALAARGWPFVTRAVAAGCRRIAPSWREAGRLAGLNRMQRWRWIAGPLLVEQVAAGAVLAFVLAVGDVEISQMLCAPGSGTLAVRLITFLHFGPNHVTASLALLELIITALPVFLYFLLTNRWLQVV